MVAFRRLLAATACVLYLLTPAWGQVASRDFEADDAGDEITVGDVAAYSFGNGTTDEPFSLALWFKPESSTAYPQLIAKRDVGPVDEWNITFREPNTFQFVIHDDSVAGAQWAITTTATCADGVWCFVAATYDGDEVTPDGAVYINGTADAATFTKTGSYVAMENTAAPLNFGRNKGVDTWYDGLAAYIHLYNRQLSAAEINQLMYCPGSVKSGLIGYWPLTDSTTQYDQSANKNNGTNSGTAASTDGPPVSVNCSGAQQ